MDLLQKEKIILSRQDIISLSFEFKDIKEECLLCLYINSKNILLAKKNIPTEIISNQLVTREIFIPAFGLHADRIILIYNKPFLKIKPDKNDEEIFNRITEAGKILGINIIDFIIIHKKEIFSFFDDFKTNNSKYYISDGAQCSLFDLMETNTTLENLIIQKKNKIYISSKLRDCPKYFEIQNRRFLGNKYKLLGFIEDVVKEKCNDCESFFDIFAGTGVVGERFNKKNIKVISNDILISNYIPLSTFLLSRQIDLRKLESKIDYLNDIITNSDNYFSYNYGNTYFTLENSRKIGTIREEIENIAENKEEKNALITSLIYATDKVANTVGHYDAFRKTLDTIQPIKLLIPKINFENNYDNEVYNEDANLLIKKISCDVLYIDPPYNSRQYCDAYHLLENLTMWRKPLVFGKAKKMDRSNIKSDYCLIRASKVFAELIKNAKCSHILVSYNNTGESKDGRSNARINDNEIIEILKNKGNIEIFERDYQAFTTGKSDVNGNSERLFYCKVKKIKI